MFLIDVLSLGFAFDTSKVEVNFILGKFDEGNVISGSPTCGFATLSSRAVLIASISPKWFSGKLSVTLPAVKSESVWAIVTYSLSI